MPGSQIVWWERPFSPQPSRVFHISYTERLSTTISEPGTGYSGRYSRATKCTQSSPFVKINVIVNVKILNGGYEDKTCVSSFTNQITQQLFGPKPLAAEQQTRLDQTEARRAVKILLETGPPPYLRVWMTAAPHPPPLPPPIIIIRRSGSAAVSDKFHQIQGARRLIWNSII